MNLAMRGQVVRGGQVRRWPGAVNLATLWSEYGHLEMSMESRVDRNIASIWSYIIYKRTRDQDGENFLARFGAINIKFLAQQNDQSPMEHTKMTPEEARDEMAAHVDGWLPYIGAAAVVWAIVAVGWCWL